jgi:hypothetical protein
LSGTFVAIPDIGEWFAVEGLYVQFFQTLKGCTVLSGGGEMQGLTHLAASTLLLVGRATYGCNDPDTGETYDVQTDLRITATLE